jgi:hypothetical protein
MSKLIDFLLRLCYNEIMAEEKQTFEIDDTLSPDDTDVLRFVLENTRGTTPVSVYRQADFSDDDTA